MIFPNDNFVIKVNDSQAPELTAYAFYYSGGWKYEAAGSLCDMPLVTEFRELTKPLYDEAKTERESAAKLLSQVEEYSPYYSYTLPDGKDVRELLDEYLINPDYLSGRAFGAAFIADGYMYTQAGSFIVPENPQPPSKPYNCDKALCLRRDCLLNKYYVLGTNEFSSPFDSYEVVRLLSVDRRGELAVNDGLICGIFYNDVPYMLCNIDNLNIRSVTFYSDGTVADISPAEMPLPVNYEFEIYAFDRLDGGIYVHDLYGYYGDDGCMLGADIKISMYKSALTGEEGDITFYRADCRLDYYNATYFLEYTTSSGGATPYYINPKPSYLYFTGGCVYSVKNDSNGNTYLSIPGSLYETVIPNTNGNCSRTFTSTIFYLPD